MKLKFYQYLFLPLMTVALLSVGFPQQVANAQAATAEKKDQDKEEKEEQDKDEKKEETDSDGLTVKDRMEIAREVGQDEGPEAALEEMRGIHEDFPKSLDVAMSLLSLTQTIGMQNSQRERETANSYFYESGKLARKVKEMKDYPEENAQVRQMIGTAIYNEACTFALDGKNEEAMKALKESFESGFEDFDHALKDSDFGDLLETDEYKKAVADGREMAKKAKSAILARRAKKIVAGMKDFESFDFEFEGMNMEGDEISKETYKGKVLIVDFWGTWCPPCRAEIPSFIKLKKEYEDKLEIVGLAYERVGGRGFNTDEDKALDKVTEFIDDNEMNYPCLLGTEEMTEQVPKLNGFPTTLFIDTKGKVRMRLVGLQPYEVLEAVAKELMEE